MVLVSQVILQDHLPDETLMRLWIEADRGKLPPCNVCDLLVT